METRNKDKSSSSKQKGAGLSMNKTGSKRQKTSGPDTPKEVVTLNMDTDEVPLKTSEMTHEFMTDITTLEDTQLADSVPKTLRLLREFHETKDQGLAVCTTKLNEMLVAALFTEAQLQSTVKILASHPWGVHNPHLKLFTLLKLEDYDWVNLSPLAIMETVITEANAEQDIITEVQKSTSTAISIGQACAKKLIGASHTRIEAGTATKVKQEGSVFTSFHRISTLFGNTKDFNPASITTMLSVFATKLDTQEITPTNREGATDLEKILGQMITLERLLSVLDVNAQETLIPHTTGNLDMTTIMSAPAVFSTAAKATAKLTVFLKQLVEASSLVQAELDDKPKEKQPNQLAQASREYKTFSQLNGTAQHQDQSATSSFQQLTEQVAIQSDVRQQITSLAEQTLIEGGPQVCKLVLSSKLTDTISITNRTNLPSSLLSTTVTNITAVCTATGIPISRACVHQLMLCNLTKIPLNKMYSDSTDQLFPETNPVVKPTDLVFYNARQLTDCFGTCMRLLQPVYGKEWCENQCRDFAAFLSLFNRGRSHLQIEGCLSMIFRDWAIRVKGWLADNEIHVPEICGEAGEATGLSFHTLTACSDRTRQVVNALMAPTAQLMITPSAFFKEGSGGGRTIDLGKLPELKGEPTVTPEELQQNVDLLTKQLVQMKNKETKLSKQVDSQAKKLAENEKKVGLLAKKVPKNQDGAKDKRKDDKKDDRQKEHYPEDPLDNGKSIFGVKLPSTRNFTPDKKGITWCDDKEQKSGFRLIGQDAPCGFHKNCRKFALIDTCHKRHDDAKDRTGKNYKWKKEKSYEEKK